MENYSAMICELCDTVVKAAVARFARPTATYRLQFAPETMTYANAAALIPYFDALGVSHLYSSPYLKSQPASGYAIVDYSQLNPDLGGDEEYRLLVDELHRHGLGQILDIVPNHMSASANENRWWRDVLENGPGSPFAPYFDIDWRPVNDLLEGKVLLPVLGDQYGRILEDGEMQLEFGDGSFFIGYHALRLPLDPTTYRQILSFGLEEFRTAMPTDSEDLRELESIVTALDHLPLRTETASVTVAERQREKEVVKSRLGKLTARSPAVADFIYRNVEQFNGRRDDPHSFNLLDALLDAQVYRLCHWKAAADEINYRRFFDINELAAVCMEEPKVFEETHRLIFELLVRGDIDGLRIDHIDGLYDPQDYLNHLQAGYLGGLGRAAYQSWKDARRLPATEPEGGAASPLPEWKVLEPFFLQKACDCFDLELPLSGPTYPIAAETVQIVSLSGAKNSKIHQVPLYVVVEKILGPEEPIPKSWPVAGTTGYDFANLINGLFVDPAGISELQKIYHRFIDEEMIFREVAYQSKILILHVAMSSDLQLLAHRLNRLSEKDRHYRDFTLNELRTALREIIACFPVYRTYIRRGVVSDQDRQFIGRAAAQAKRRNPARNPAIFDFIRDVLLLKMPDLKESRIAEWSMFVGRFQQATSPVMAKGIEDTAFYRHFPLVSLNEVGGDPTLGGTPLEEFHRQNIQRQTDWPNSLICTSTHDTKHSEDVRARINVLSEIPTVWRAAVNRWKRLNRRHRREVDGGPAPSANDEYLFYQNLVGFWPIEPFDGKMLPSLVERMQSYMEKATREAKSHTSWINPVADYDAAVREFVAEVLKHRPTNRFLADFRDFHQQIINWGLYAALSQVTLKIFSPGVPDIYQGQEMWDFSLVDPDNRRPVDFAMRQNLLKGLEEAVGHDEELLLGLARELAANPRDTRSKFFVTWRCLQFRRMHAEIFQRGEYLPLKCEGTAAKHLCAFAWRSMPGSGERPRVVIVAVPRWIAELMKTANEADAASPPVGSAVWRDTCILLKGIAPFEAVNLFTGQACTVKENQFHAADLFSDFPVVALVNAE